MPTQKLTAEILAAAIEGYEAQKRRTDERIAELRQMLAGSSAEPAAPEVPKRKRKMSAAGRRAISEATKKRWAAFHAANQPEKPTVAKKAPSRKAAVKKVARKKTAAKKASVTTAKRTAGKKAAKTPDQAAPVAQ